MEILHYAFLCGRYNIMDMVIKTAWESKVFRDKRKRHLANGKTNAECINCSF